MSKEKQDLRKLMERYPPGTLVRMEEPGEWYSMDFQTFQGTTPETRRDAPLAYTKSGSIGMILGYVPSPIFVHSLDMGVFISILFENGPAMNGWTDSKKILYFLEDHAVIIDGRFNHE